MKIINNIETYCFDVVGFDYVIDDMIEVRDACNAAWRTGHAIAYIRDLDGFLHLWKKCPVTLMHILDDEHMSEIDFTVDIDNGNRIVFRQVETDSSGAEHVLAAWKVRLARQAQIIGDT
jgi:hypothetical protein